MDEKTKALILRLLNTARPSGEQAWTLVPTDVVEQFEELIESAE